MVDFYDPHCCSPHTRNGQIATILVYQDFFETFPVGNATSRGQLYSFPILVWKSSHILIVVRRFLDGVKLSYSLYFLFWLGNDSDQLCSFVFTISNVPLFVCVYLDNFSDDWQKCKNSSRTWPIAFGLAIIPFIIRLVQSVKRYVDSKLVTHLMNVSFLFFCASFSNVVSSKAGKYGAGIVSYLLYFMWSYQRKNKQLILLLWHQTKHHFYYRAQSRFNLCSVVCC